ncbi:MAG: sulfite exporter TauE/SafE family protein [Chloroflexota bacterium]|nr:MAG: sulfite exporter TauE/SafE family protein [Chloroflexota bacterium]
MGIAEALEFVGIGLVAGSYGTLVGAGGGFLVVPMLMLFYGATPQSAAGTSLAVVFLNALSGTMSYARQKRIDYRTGVRFAVATLPGAAIGAYVSQYLTAEFFNVLFGLVLVALALFLIVRPDRVPSAPASGSDDPPAASHGLTWRTVVDARGEIFTYGFNQRNGIILSFFVGFFSSVLGIGGGIIHVPAMVYLFNFPAHIATATSHFILAISAAAGAGSHLVFGHVLYLPAALMGVGVIVGAQIGAAISHRIRGRWLIRLLSVALIVVGLRLVLGGVLG